MVRKPQLSVLRVVLARLAQHPAILLWYIADEPDGNGYPAAYTQQIYDTIKSLDPHGRPVAMCFNTVSFLSNEAPGGGTLPTRAPRLMPVAMASGPWG